MLEARFVASKVVVMVHIYIYIYIYQYMGTSKSSKDHKEYLINKHKFESWGLLGCFLDKCQLWA